MAEKSRLTWFWRIVCSPGCTTTCKTSCPGCHALASEWESLGVAPKGHLPKFPFAPARLKLRWIYWAALLRSRRQARRQRAA